MTRIALLVTVLALGCSNQRPEERKLPGSAAPTTTSAPAPAPTGPATPGPATPEPKATGFQPFDDALAGKQPWIAADDTAGIVELHAIEDLSDRTKRKLTVERRCGADAARAVEAIGKQMAERAKSGHAPPACKEDGGITRCSQPGRAEGDVVLALEYGKRGDAWRVIGAKTYGVGMKLEEQEGKYAALLEEACK